jgi:hypothetical protein
MTADRAGYIAGMRQVLDALEKNPGADLPRDGSTLPLGFSFWGDDARERMAATARALPCSSWAKSTDDTYFRMSGQILGLDISLTAYRDAVCTRTVTGTEVREVEVEVTPAVTEKVMQEVEVVAWDCHAILAPADDEDPEATS